MSERRDNLSLMWILQQLSRRSLTKSSKMSSTSVSTAPDTLDAVDTSAVENRSKFVDEIHFHLICPITHELMIDPVVAEDGNTYERIVIEKWIKSKGTSPMIPRMRLDVDKLLANRSVQSATIAYVESGGCGTDLARNWREAKKEVKVAMAKREILRAEKHLAAGRVDKAATIGLPKAQGIMADRYYLGTNGVAKDPDQCFFWAKKAAEGGDVLGQFRLAYAFHVGDGTAQDHKAALKWYEFVAESPTPSSYHGVACNNIGIIFEGGGFGVQQDYSQSMRWYLRGDRESSEDAQNHIGEHYKNGIGVQKDLAAARSWFQKSAAQKHPPAMFELGIMESKGEGGAMSEVSGMRLIVESARLGHKGAKAALRKFATCL